MRREARDVRKSKAPTDAVFLKPQASPLKPVRKTIDEVMC